MKLSPLLARSFMQACHPLAGLLLTLVMSTATLAQDLAFTASPATAVAAGKPYSYQIKVAAADGKTPYNTAIKLPGWLSAEYKVDAASALVSTVDVLSADQGYIHDMALDRQGNLYLAIAHQTKLGQILKITPDHNVQVLASELINPDALAVTSNGTVYVATTTGGPLSNLPYKTEIHRLNSNGTLTLINNEIDRIQDMEADSKGNLIILRTDGPARVNQIFRMALQGAYTVLAGSSVPQQTDKPEEQQIRDGTGANALLALADNLTIDASDTVYVADIQRNLRQITAAGLVTTRRDVEVPYFVRDFAIDPQGGFYFFEQTAVSHSKAGGANVLLAGNRADSTDAVDGAGLNARFNTVAAGIIGQHGALYVADWKTHLNYWQGHLRKLEFSISGIAGVPATADIGLHPVILQSTNLVSSIQQSFFIQVNRVTSLQDQTIIDPVLTPGEIVEGGKLGGLILGNSTTPPLLNSEILPGSRLRDVIIGTGASLAPSSTLENVDFVSNQTIPIGIRLDAALGYMRTYAHDYVYPGKVDLSQSVLLEPFPIIDQLRKLAPKFQGINGLMLTAEGNLYYEQSGLHYQVEPFAVLHIGNDPENPRASDWMQTASLCFLPKPAERYLPGPRWKRSWTSFSVWTSLDLEADQQRMALM